MLLVLQTLTYSLEDWNIQKKGGEILAVTQCSSRGWWALVKKQLSPNLTERPELL